MAPDVMVAFGRTKGKPATARAEREARRAAEERSRAERLAERLRALGLNPHDLDR